MCKRNNLRYLALIFLLLLAIQCSEPAIEDSLNVSSPDSKIQVTFTLEGGVPHYSVSRSGKDIIKPSKLGFVFKEDKPLDQNLTIASGKRNTFDEIWTQPWGEVKEIRNHYNELRVDLEETTAARRKLSVVFRVYDDGLGFRYEVPEQDNLSDFQIMDEETEFVLAGNHQAWWIPAYKDNRYEYLYRQSPISFLATRAVRAVHPPAGLNLVWPRIAAPGLVSGAKSDAASAASRAKLVWPATCGRVAEQLQTETKDESCKATG